MADLDIAVRYQTVPLLQDALCDEQVLRGSPVGVGLEGRNLRYRVVEVGRGPVGVGDDSECLGHDQVPSGGSGPIPHAEGPALWEPGPGGRLSPVLVGLDGGVEVVGPAVGAVAQATPDLALVALDADQGQQAQDYETLGGAMLQPALDVPVFDRGLDAEAAIAAGPGENPFLGLGQGGFHDQVPSGGLDGMLVDRATDQNVNVEAVLFGARSGGVGGAVGPGVPVIDGALGVVAAVLVIDALVRQVEVVGVGGLDLGDQGEVGGAGLVDCCKGGVFGGPESDLLVEGLGGHEIRS